MPRKVKVEKSIFTGEWHAWARIGIFTVLRASSKSKVSAKRKVERQLWKSGWRRYYDSDQE